MHSQGEKMSQKVSVIMSTYNEPLEYVKLSISSILNQTYNNLQIIIISDNPDNYSVNEYIRQVAENDPRVETLYNSKNRGLVYSLNRALKLAGGNYVARMDADDISCNDRIEKQLMFLEQNKLDIVGSNITLIDNNGNNLGEISSYPETDKQIKKYFKYRDCVPHPSWLVKKEVYISLSGYRNIIASEDFDFLARAALKGYKLGNVAEPLLNYRINPKGISSTQQALQTASRDYIRKYYRKGIVASEDKYNEFVQSNAWKKRVASIERYCRLRDVYKGLKKPAKSFYGIYMIAASPGARNVLFTKLMSERIKIK